MFEIKPYTFLIDENLQDYRRYFIEEITEDKEYLKEGWEEGRFRKGTLKEYLEGYDGLTCHVLNTAEGIYVRTTFKTYMTTSKAKDEYKIINNEEKIYPPQFKVKQIGEIQRHSTKSMYKLDITLKYRDATYRTMMIYDTWDYKWKLSNPEPLFEENCPLCCLKGCGAPYAPFWCYFLSSPQMIKSVLQQLLEDKNTINKWTGDKNPIRIKMALRGAFENNF